MEAYIVKHNTRNILAFTADTDLPKREFNRALPALFDEVVFRWHEKYLPKHFDEGAASRYGYQKRSRKYNEKKLRKLGHTRELVYSGETQRRLESSIEARSTSRGGRGILRGPKHLYAYRKDYRQPDKAAEVVRLSQDELDDLARYLTDLVAQHLVQRSIQEERISATG